MWCHQTPGREGLLVSETKCAVAFAFLTMLAGFVEVVVLNALFMNNRQSRVGRALNDESYAAVLLSRLLIDQQ